MIDRDHKLSITRQASLLKLCVLLFKAHQLEQSAVCLLSVCDVLAASTLNSPCELP